MELCSVACSFVPGRKRRRMEEKMCVNKTRNSILLLTALIWGTAFVAQSKGGKEVGPFTFNCIRSLIGGSVLIPVIFLLRGPRHSEHHQNTEDKNREQNRKNLILGGTLCGTLLFLASTMQQLGMYYGAKAGKAGFLTACYILIVPIIGIFLRKKCSGKIWIGVILTLAGLYLLCVDERFVIKFYDVLLMLCAVLFAFHIITVDRFSMLADGVQMSCLQFFTCGILGFVPMFVVDMKHSINGIKQWLPLLGTSQAWIPILYAGILSCGVGYTLQIIGQKGMNPAIASLLMSLESVFSVLAGWIILGEKMGRKEIAGCVLIFIAIIIAQIPDNVLGKRVITK